jgi:hypothetical protein
VAILLALAAIAFTASGVPDNRGTDAGIGWFAFLALALALVVLAGAAGVRRLRRNGAASAQTLPHVSRRSKDLA